MLPFAIIAISLALVFYTIGVWAERIKGVLKPWHLITFWLGFAFDTTGTTLMGQVAGSFTLNFHSATGLLAILLMLFHAVWATIVLARRQEEMKKKFHRFSIIVWLIWLVPYLSGMVFGMARG